MKILPIGSLWLLFFSINFQVFVQSAKHTISGTIKDAGSGETLIGATVRVAELPGTGAATNEFGLYSLTLPGGTYQLVFSYIGYLHQ